MKFRFSQFCSSQAFLLKTRMVEKRKVRLSSIGACHDLAKLFIYIWTFYLQYPSKDQTIFDLLVSLYDPLKSVIKTPSSDDIIYEGSPNVFDFAIPAPFLKISLNHGKLIIMIFWPDQSPYCFQHWRYYYHYFKLHITSYI